MRDPRLWSHGRFLAYALLFSALFLLHNDGGALLCVRPAVRKHLDSEIDQEVVIVISDPAQP